jgi:hypothetical protein
MKFKKGSNIKISLPGIKLKLYAELPPPADLYVAMMVQKASTADAHWRPAV